MYDFFTMLAFFATVAVVMIIWSVHLHMVWPSVVVLTPGAIARYVITNAVFYLLAGGTIGHLISSKIEQILLP